MTRRTLLYLLLAAALLMRVLVPQGYMPERSADGGIAVTLCDSDGVWLIPFEDGAAPEEKNQRADQPCAFAGLGAAALRTPTVADLPPPAPVGSAYAEHRVPGLAHRVERLLPPARGPPLAA